MKNKNAYVSQKEVFFTASEVLVTKTDTKGIITYTNEAFEKIAGYSREELVGKSHNIVRHPDMPPQAFKWLWDTLKSERPWRGMVKNRCKNGDHYWVRATVAPIIENGRITGYVSVRKLPTRDQVSAAEAFYRELNASGAEVVSRYERLKIKNWSLKAKLQVAIQLPLLIVLSIAQWYMTDTLKDDSLRAAGERGNQIANQIIDSANMLMVTGQIGVVADRQLLLHKVTSSGHVKTAQLVSVQQVVDQFGSGLAEEHLSDAVQQQVIDSKQQKITFSHDTSGNHILRVTTPYLASKDFHGTDCTSCHTVAEGAVLGASDVVIDLNPEFKHIKQLEFRILMGQFALQIFLFLFIGYCVDRFIRRPLSEVNKEFRHIMEGNLDTELDITIQDEMGKMLCEIQTMQAYLRTMVDEIVTPVGQIQGRIYALEGRVVGVANNAVTEQDHIQSIAASMEEFSQSVAEVAEMAADSLSEARATQKIVEENNRNMDLSVAATTRVAETVQASSKTISDLGSSIHQIDMISNAIKDIAEQTNLLALNAAIEAARAGEQGRGFAVVADEVRKLAERTATSTKDISRTIAEISAISESAVRSMHGAVSEVETGIALIRQNGEGLKEIMVATVNVAGRIESIATASREQASASESVAASLERITTLVDSNAQSASEAKVAAAALNVSAEELKRAGYPLTKCASN